jgi:hypothetical protein
MPLCGGQWSQPGSHYHTCGVVKTVSNSLAEVAIVLAMVVELMNEQ